MKVASFDIGINNLAYCILSKNKIYDLDLICLFPQNEKRQCAHCSIMAKWQNINNEHVCKKHGGIKQIKRINTKNVSYADLAKRLIAAIPRIKGLEKCKKIVIERQPRLVSNKIQFISQSLYFYLCLLFPNATVSYAPKDKFAAYTGPPIRIGGTTRNTKYLARKKAGIEMARYMLEVLGEYEWLEYFDSGEFEKKDDLSDALLQGLTLFIK